MRKVLYILGELQDSDLQWLVDVGQIRNLPIGTEIIREGGSVDSLFIVLEGDLRVSKGGPRDRDSVHRRGRGGDVAPGLATSDRDGHGHHSGHRLRCAAQDTAQQARA